MGPTSAILIPVEISPELKKDLRVAIGKLFVEINPRRKGDVYAVTTEVLPGQLHEWEIRLMPAEPQDELYGDVEFRYKAVVELDTATNQKETWQVLRKVTKSIAQSLGGIAIEPTK